MSVLRYEDVDVNEINFSKPEKIGTSYFGSISYGTELKPLYVQTPRLKSLINVCDIQEKKNPHLEVEIPNGHFDIYDFFLNLDDNCIKTTFQKSQEWFGKELPLEAIDDMFKRTTKPFKKNENPVMKFKLPVVKNKIQCGVYNQQRVFLDINDIKCDSEVILVLHLRGLKILKQNFYFDCYVSQIKVFQDKDTKYNIIPEYAVIEEKDDYDDIFNQEILKATGKLKDEEEEQKEREEREAEELKEKEEKERKEREEEEKRKEREEQERKEQERQKIQEEIERKRKEMEELMKKMEN
tara:strand:- start:302 stop:1189 length:888 start_codon:yes stop_codon:yes gene_type:complete